MEALKYPIGRWQRIENPNVEQLHQYISDIEKLPSKLIPEVKDLNDKVLSASYREGGWNVRQIVHHIADSHLNAFIRCKLILTEDNPTIKPYDENLWVETADAQGEIEDSLKLLEGLHVRWSKLLTSVNEEDWKKTFYHPESKRKFSLEEVCGLYAWHGNHHLAHILSAKNNPQW